MGRTLTKQKGVKAMKGQVTELCEILDVLPSTDHLEVKITLHEGTEEEQELTILDDSYARWYMLRNYRSWRYPSYCDNNDIHTIAVDFFQSWQHFASQGFNKFNWMKLYEAMMDKGNPLENYDRYEDTKLSFTGSEKDEVQMSGTETNRSTTPDGGYTDTVENFSNPEDTADTYRPTAKTTTKMAHRDDSTELSFDNRKDTSTKTFTDRMDTTVSHIHGNIGVTTSAQMTMEQIRLRVYNIADSILAQFVQQNCF